MRLRYYGITFLLLLVIVVMVGVALHYWEGVRFTDHQRLQLETWVSNALKQDVRFKAVSFVWSKGQPALKAEGVSLRAKPDKSHPQSKKPVSLSMEEVYFFPAWSQLTFSNSQAHFTGGRIELHQLAILPLALKLPLLSAAVSVKDNKVHVRFAKLLVYRQRFNGLKLEVLPQAAGSLVVLNHPHLMGKMTVPASLSSSASVITVHLKKLMWDHPMQVSAASKYKPLASLNPANLPSIDLMIDTLFYREALLHQINVGLRKQRHGMRVTHFNFNFSSAKLSAYGYWLERKGKPWSQLTGNVRTNHVEAVVKHWDLHHYIRKGAGRLDFTLQWPGIFYHPDWAAVKGKASFKVQNGLIHHIPRKVKKKLDLLRLLNLFSPSSLIQQFGINFGRRPGGQVADLDMPYDLMQARFTLQQGNAYVQHFYLLARLFNIKGQGRVGFVRKDFNLTLWIHPTVSSGDLPIAAALIGGPIAGAIGWLADKVLVEPFFEESLAKQFYVTGPWHRPRVLQGK